MSVLETDITSLIRSKVGKRIVHSAVRFTVHMLLKMVCFSRLVRRGLV
jgi:hypothetical protein